MRLSTILSLVILLTPQYVQVLWQARVSVHTLVLDTGLSYQCSYTCNICAVRNLCVLRSWREDPVLREAENPAAGRQNRRRIEVLRRSKIRRRNRWACLFYLRSIPRSTVGSSSGANSTVAKVHRVQPRDVNALIAAVPGNLFVFVLQLHAKWICVESNAIMNNMKCSSIKVILFVL